MASTYQALYGANSCTISLDANGLSTPAGFIPTGRIAQWVTGGDACSERERAQAQPR